MRFPLERRLTCLALAPLLLIMPWNSALAGTAQSVDLASVAQAWNVDYDVHGAKAEPTFVEHVEYARHGDRFVLSGDIAGETLGVEVLDLDQDGAISVAACPGGSVCTDSPPNGFLSTVAVLAALRSGRLSGSGDLITYAGRTAVCVPLEAIQPTLDEPVVMDPCLDVQSGALLAQRRRFDGQFGGAMLDESSFHLEIAIGAST